MTADQQSLKNLKKQTNLKNAPSDAIISVYNLYGTATSISLPNPQIIGR